MSKLDELLAESQTLRPGPKCALGRHLATLTPEERAELIAIIRHPRVKPALITRDFGGDLHLPADIILRHRNGKCIGCATAGTFPA